MTTNPFLILAKIILLSIPIYSYGNFIWLILQDELLKLNEYAQYYSANIVVIRTMNKIMDEFFSLFR
jgi:hypothetical protein